MSQFSAHQGESVIGRHYQTSLLLPAQPVKGTYLVLQDPGQNERHVRERRTPVMGRSVDQRQANNDRSRLRQGLYEVHQRTLLVPPQIVVGNVPIRELDEWISEASGAIAYAATAASAVIDFQAAVIDGAFPAEIRDRLVARVAAALETHDRQGLSPLRVVPGTVGPNAREIGGGSLPLFANFAMDREVLFKEA